MIAFLVLSGAFLALSVVVWRVWLEAPSDNRDATPYRAPQTGKAYTQADWERGHEDVRRWLAKHPYKERVGK